MALGDQKVNSSTLAISGPAGITSRNFGILHPKCFEATSVRDGKTEEPTSRVKNKQHEQ